MVVSQVVPRQTKATQFQQKLNVMKVKFNASEEVIPACARRHDAVHSSSLLRNRRLHIVLYDEDHTL